MTLSFDQQRDLFFVAIAGHAFAVLGFLCWSLRNKNNKKTISSKPLNNNQLYRELVHSTVIPCHALLIYIFWRFKIIHFADNVFTSQLWTSFIGLIWLEIWFYVSHRAFHTQTLYRFHKTHHYSVRNTPMSGLSFSLFEKVFFSSGYLFGIALLSYMIPISFNTLCCVYLAYLAINAIGHSNYEFFSPQYPQSFLGRFLATATYHSLHHHVPTSNYGLMTRFLDRLFKTESNSYEHVMLAMEGEENKAQQQELAKAG